MDLLQQLQKEHSKRNCTAIVQWIGDDLKRFNELFQLFLKGEFRVAQCASWPLRYAVEAHPIFLRNKFGTLLKNLERTDTHEAIKRNTLNILEAIDIPAAFEGQVMDLCFRYIADPAEKAAPKASSITILSRLAEKYPEIKNELKTVIEERWPFEGAAFRARARRVLKNK